MQLSTLLVTLLSASVATAKTITVPFNAGTGECAPSPSTRVSFNLTITSPGPVAAISGAYVVDPEVYNNLTRTLPLGSSFPPFPFLSSFSCEGSPTVRECHVNKGASVLFSQEPVKKCLLLLPAPNAVQNVTVDYDAQWATTTAASSAPSTLPSTLLPLALSAGLVFALNH
ncbi:hypothetical protein BJ684DRAFT_18901 [Piptocephalis cylindrospora]|uniref:Uncharacterized protein n=1 Tax=Piptocephalis cylindrospora TaxID=1907219 RepID=A0A4V1IYI9_9FUNG|nr:hypothetical protein BJ684DRAFT_18901 [Piptocephalis cylindrospora]|eukprot:RKP14719.1 hypothetical protein BJ684DRAFT_18901 [Piptocephalis cylindrospora]